MQSDLLSDVSIAKAAAGIAGAFVSLNFLEGTMSQKLVLACGGSLMSYFFSTQTALYLGMKDAEGMIGFLIGMFGMAIASKVFEVIKNADTQAILSRFWSWLERKWGA